MSEVIVFTSGKGGVGKSNLCLNSALELTALHYRTCLFDGDLGLANVNILLGIDQEYTLDDVVFRQKSLDDILVHTGYGFDIIPGSSGAEQIANLNDAQLESLIAALSAVGAYDYFLIDTASGISKSVMSFCMAARQTIIVITHEATSLTDAYALLKILSVNGYQGAVKILINDCESVAQAKKTYIRYKKVVDKHLDISIAPAGIILHDDHFERAVIQQKPLLELFPESIGAQCVKAFVANLTRADSGSQQESLADFWQRYLEQIKQSGGSARETGADEQAGGVAAPGGEWPGRPAALRAGPLQRAADAAALTPLVQDFRPVFRPAQPLHGFFSTPALLGMIFRRINYGEVTAAELKRLLTADPALTAQTLHLLTARDGSALRRHIDRLDQITEGLDDQDVHALLLKAAVASAIKAVDGDEEDRLMKSWQASYRTAVFARALAAAAGFAFPEEAYLCGLLGRIDRFMAAADRDGQDHQRSGQQAAEILSRLGFNSMMCDAVRFSGYPAEQVKTAFDLVRIVYTARLLATDEPAPDDEVFGEMLGLTGEQALEAIEKARAEIGTTVDALEMNDGPHDSSGKKEKHVKLSGYLLDNLLTGTLMAPDTGKADLNGWALRLHRNCSLLFDMERIISFVADTERGCLTAIDYAGCFYSDSLANYVVPVTNSTSLLSRAYTTGSLVIEDVSDDRGAVNLGDRQLARLLGDPILICIPLKYGGITRGIVVCATGDADVVSLTAIHSRLASLGARAAQELAAISSSEAGR